MKIQIVQFSIPTTDKQEEGLQPLYDHCAALLELFVFLAFSRVEDTEQQKRDAINNTAGRSLPFPHREKVGDWVCRPSGELLADRWLTRGAQSHIRSTRVLDKLPSSVPMHLLPPRINSNTKFRSPPDSRRHQTLLLYFCRGDRKDTRVKKHSHPYRCKILKGTPPQQRELERLLFSCST